jgi:hypothetical protein
MIWQTPLSTYIMTAENKLTIKKNKKAKGNEHILQHKTQYEKRNG